MARPTALQRFARRALLIRARNDAALTELIPAGHIDPEGTPEWPFFLIEAPRTRQLRAACVRGATASFDLHAFVRPREQAGSVVETGYDYASRIGAALESTFADNRLLLENNAVCRIELSDTNLLKEGEPDAWHWFSQINCRVLAE